MGDLAGNDLTNLIYTNQRIRIILVDDKGECISSNQRLRSRKAVLAQTFLLIGCKLASHDNCADTIIQ